MEFLLQRVEDINQELKAKDDLLEIAQGRVKAEELASRVNATVSMETATQPDSNKSPPAVSPLDVAISMQTAISDSSKSPPDVFQDMHINSNNHLPPLSLLPLPFCNSDIYMQIWLIAKQINRPKREDIARLCGGVNLGR